jgi:cyclase
MLKKRIVACLVLKGGRVVQSIGFCRYLPVGSLSVSLEFLNNWGIDEVAVIDIDATTEKRKPDFERITEVSKKHFVALTVGGGIQTLEDMRKLIHCGADKVMFNTLALKDPGIIKDASDVLGCQSVVISIDVKRNAKGEYEVFSDGGRKPSGLTALAWAKRVESLGAGEILLNSIDKDGMKSGFDIALIRSVAGAVKIPVIALGGAGHPSHFLAVLKDTNACAAAASNFFHFSEHSPIVLKSFLRSESADIRLDTYSDYANVTFDESGRIAKRPEDYLEKLRFEYIPQEVI